MYVLYVCMYVCIYAIKIERFVRPDECMYVFMFVHMEHT